MTTMVATAPTIAVNGAPVPADWQNKLTLLRIDRALRLVGRATLKFADGGYALSSANVFTLGGAVKLGLHTGETVMVGTVTGISLEQHADDTPILSVVVDDNGFKLTRSTRVKTYLNVSYADVISQLASAVGLTASVGNGASDPQEYLLQSGTDLAFIEMICVRAGLTWWVGGSDGRQLNVKRPGDISDTATVTLGQDLIEFSVQASGLRPNDVTVNGWDPAAQQGVSGHVSTGSAPTASATFVDSYQNPAKALGSAPSSSRDLNPLTADEATTVAQALYDDWAASSVVARGTGLVNSNLQPGTMLTVANAGPSSGSYRIGSVEHVYTSHGFYTKFRAGRTRPANLVDTLGPSEPNAGLLSTGLVVGVVTDNNDPDSAGRVKVKFTGIADVVSQWARMVAVGAGAQRGAIFMPEVNDEVIVGFEHGDTRRPVVLGGLYSKRNTLPDWGMNGSAVEARRITSAAGHIFEFGEVGNDPTKSHVLIKLAGGQHKLRLGADRFDLEVASGKPISIKAGSAKFEITESGDVNIEGANISIKASAALSLEGNSQATVKASGTAELSGAQVSVKGSGTGTIDGGGMLTVKGGMVAIN
jgi:uncharacterized protein involved in type VI secretion and phage assembly